MIVLCFSQLCKYTFVEKKQAASLRILWANSLQLHLFFKIILKKVKTDELQICSILKFLYNDFICIMEESILNILGRLPP